MAAAAEQARQAVGGINMIVHHENPRRRRIGDRDSRRGRGGFGPVLSSRAG